MSAASAAVLLRSLKLPGFLRAYSEVADVISSPLVREDGA